MASVSSSQPTAWSAAPTNQTIANQGSQALVGQPAPVLPHLQYPVPDPLVLQQQWESMYPAQSDPTFYMQQAQQALANIPAPPAITIPQVAPVTVAFPQGNYQALADAQYAGQFEPVQRELERRESQQDAALNAQLAQTGLADSGTGIGQRQALSRDFSEQLGAASSAIAGQAQARALEAQLAVATQQANIDIQRNLANANLSYMAQNANARNILEHGVATGNALVTALGYDAQAAESMRGQFVQFIDSQTRAALGQSEIARAALADIFNAILQEGALQMRSKELALQYARLESEEGIARDQLDLGNRQLTATTDYQTKQLQQQDQALQQQAAQSYLQYGQQPYKVTDAQTGAPINQSAKDYQRAVSSLGFGA